MNKWNRYKRDKRINRNSNKPKPLPEIGTMIQSKIYGDGVVVKQNKNSVDVVFLSGIVKGLRP